jgi:thioesterase domain-containing protein/acyl carrier protein
MVPQRIVVVDALPRLASGKLDRRVHEEAFEREQADAEPMDLLEMRLQQLWANALALPAVALDRNFFDLGGDSIQALSLFHEISAQLGAELPVSTLLESPTVSQLAARVRVARGEKAPWPLVELRRGTGLDALFLTPDGLFGALVGYHRLLSHLPSGLTVFGLLPPKLDATPNVVELAKTYVDAMEAVWPTGACGVSGYSYGGVLAFEIACETARRELPLQALVLAESKPPRVRTAVRLETLCRRALSFCKGESAARPPKLQATRRPGRSTAAQFAAVQEAARDYRARPYPRAITLLITDSLRRKHCHTWAALAKGGLTTHALPGRHGDLLEEPLVRKVARHIVDALGEV